MIRVALVGAGAWAQSVHLPSLLNHPRFDVVGMWARDASKATLVASSAGIRAFRDFPELLEATEVVDFAVPPSAQIAHAMIAAEQGKHLLLEKPVALSSRDASELSLLLDQRGIHGRVFLSRLFDPARRDWVEHMADKELTRGQLEWRSSGMRASSPGALDWRGALGALYDVGPHIIAQLERVLGPAVSLSASDYGRALTRLELSHASGATSSATLDLHADVPFTQEHIHFAGSGGAHRYSSQGGVDFRRAFGLLLDEFARDLEGALAEDPTRRRLTSVSDSSRVLRLLEAALP